MYDNIGRKIMALAKVLCWICIIISIISGIILITQDFLLYGILTAVIGSIISWISSFILYGFGQLVENSTIIKEQSNIRTKILLSHNHKEE